MIKIWVIIIVINMVVVVKNEARGSGELPEYVGKIIRLSNFASYISGREQNLPFRIRLLKILLEKSVSVKDVAESIDGISYVETYNSIYSLERHGILERRDSGNVFSVAEGYREIVSAIVNIYDLLVEKLGEEKARRFFFSVFQNKHKMSIVLGVYLYDGIEIEELYDVVARILSKLREGRYIRRSITRGFVIRSSVRRYAYILMREGYLRRNGGLHISDEYRRVLEAIVEYAKSVRIEQEKPTSYEIPSIGSRVILRIGLWDPSRFRGRITEIMNTLTRMLQIIEGIENQKDLIERYMDQMFIEDLISPNHIHSKIDLIKRLDNALSDFLQRYDELLGIYENLRSYMRILHDESEKLVKIREGLKNLLNNLQVLKESSGERFVNSLRHILNIYSGMARFVSDNAKRKFIEFIIKESIERADRYLDEIMQLLLNMPESEKRIIGQILAEKLRSKIEKKKDKT